MMLCIRAKTVKGGGNLKLKVCFGVQMLPNRILSS